MAFFPGHRGIAEAEEEALFFSPLSPPISVGGASSFPFPPFSRRGRTLEKEEVWQAGKRHPG